MIRLYNKNRRIIRPTYFHRCCHPIQILWLFIWEVTIVQFGTRNWVHVILYKQINFKFIYSHLFSYNTTTIKNKK